MVYTDGRYVDAAPLREQYYKVQKLRPFYEKQRAEAAESERQRELQIAKMGLDAFEAWELEKEPWRVETLGYQMRKSEEARRYRKNFPDSSNTVPQRMNHTKDAKHKDSDAHPPVRWSNFLKRRSTMSVPISVAIPEESAEELRGLPENVSSMDDRLRHDSGAHSLSHSPVPSLNKVTQSTVQHTTTLLGPTVIASYSMPHQVAPQTKSVAGDPVECSASVPTVSDDSDNDFTVGLTRTSIAPERAGKRAVVATVTREQIAAFEARFSKGKDKGKGRATEPTEYIEEPQNPKQARPTSIGGQMQSAPQDNLYNSHRPSSLLSMRSGRLGSMTRAVQPFDIIEEDQRASGPSTIRHVM
jgi:hypothetical protein